MKKRPRVYIVAMLEVKEVTGTAPDMWLITGTGLSRRSWSCHSQTPLFTTIAEAEQEVKRQNKFNAYLREKYSVKEERF